MGANMKNKAPNIKNESGLAVLESVIILFIFIVLSRYSMGFFGVTHTAILQTIASRTYSFEIFRHRSHLWWFRSNKVGNLTYHKYENRIHGTNNEIAQGGTDTRQYPTERRIAMFVEEDPQGRSTNEHSRSDGEVRDGQRNEALSLDPVWIKSQYGICLTEQCGD
jgi:hypothetical protein